MKYRPGDICSFNLQVRYRWEWCVEVWLGPFPASRGQERAQYKTHRTGTRWGSCTLPWNPCISFFPARGEDHRICSQPYLRLDADFNQWLSRGRVALVLTAFRFSCSETCHFGFLQVVSERIVHFCFVMMTYAMESGAWENWTTDRAVGVFTWQRISVLSVCVHGIHLCDVILVNILFCESCVPLNLSGGSDPTRYNHSILLHLPSLCVYSGRDFCCKTWMWSFVVLFLSGVLDLL